MTFGTIHHRHAEMHQTLCRSRNKNRMQYSRRSNALTVGALRASIPSDSRTASRRLCVTFEPRRPSDIECIPIRRWVPVLPGREVPRRDPPAEADGVDSRFDSGRHGCTGFRPAIYQVAVCCSRSGRVALVEVDSPLSRDCASDGRGRHAVLGSVEGGSITECTPARLARRA